MHAFPAEAERGNALGSCYSSPTVNKYPFRGLFSATFFRFLWVILLFKMAPSAVLSAI